MMMNSQQPQRTYPLAVYPPLAPPTPLAISNSMSPHGITLSSSQSAALSCSSSTASGFFQQPPQQQCDSLFQQQQQQLGKTTTNSISNEIWNLYQQLNYQENEAIQRILSEGLNIELLNESLKKIENILTQKTDTIRQYMNEDEVSTSPVLPVLVAGGHQSKSIPKILQIRPAEELSGFVRNINSGSSILIEDQPYGNVVANKYLEPPLRVKVSEEFNLLAKEGSLQVTAVLCGSLTETRINRTSDGKQNILQGYTILPITPEGYATFNKLKIMDVSSKHHHQPFSIQLQLQEIKKTGSVVNIGDPIKSAPLRVQSRINKKGTATSSSSSSARSNIFNLNNKSNKKKSRTDLDCNYIDITSLLVLPQKEAASKLGISESMLCKRFKECTRRKWPYRYLRKIDKMLQMFSPKSGYFAAGACTEDQEKIERLKREREECLQPVKIRITGNDKVSVKLQSMILTKSDGAIMSETESEEGSSFVSSQDQEEIEIHSFEDDEISQVAETLNSLKQPTLAV